MNGILKFSRSVTGQLLMLSLVAFAIPALALSYEAPLDGVGWHISSSKLECRMEQEIPAFGESVFSKKAGEDLAFYLKPYHPVIMHGSARLLATPPSWKPDVATRDIAEIEVVDTIIPLELEGYQAGLVLDYLNSGLRPTLDARGAGYGDQFSPVRVVVSTVNFPDAYGEYQACLAQLLPVNYQQIARSAIFFSINKSGLSEDVRQQLDLIASYVKADKGINRIYIDGHTDDTGTKKMNRNLSKKRAQMVANYFQNAGVKKNILTTRFHADKYPALKNDSEVNRVRNRRVTIRLERD